MSDKMEQARGIRALSDAQNLSQESKLAAFMSVFHPGQWRCKGCLIWVNVGHATCPSCGTSQEINE